MDGRSIPGYYWDAAHRKYFKIQPSHAAPPGSKYSKDSVLKIEKESRVRTQGFKRKHVEMQTNMRRRQLIQRSSILSSASVTGIALERELGKHTGQSQGQVARTKAFVEQLHPNRVVRSAHASISAFDIDCATGGLFLGISDHSTRGILVSVPSKTQKGALSLHKFNPMDVFRSPISTVCVTPSQCLVSCTLGSSRRPSINIAKKATGHDSPDGVWPHYGSLSAVVFEPKVNTIWTGACNSLSGGSTTDRIAFGTSSKLLQLTISDESREVILEEDPLRTTSDILAVDWLTPSTIAAGLRNREILLWDARSRGTAIRLRHAAPVCNLRRAGSDHSVVVAGFNDAMALYDLRMSRLPEKQAKVPSRPNSKRGRIVGPEPSSQPLFKYPDYANEHTYPLGFDVQTELGLIAAADDEGNIQAFQLQTGEPIQLRERYPTAPPATEATVPLPSKQSTTDFVRCIRFVDDDRSCTKLIASRGHDVIEYAW